MQKKSAGSENLIGVGGSIKDGAAKIWGQLVVGLLSNFKNRILGGWLSLSFQIGSGWGHVGNGVVDPPKLRVFAVGTVPVLMLSIHLDSRTELWGNCC